MQGAAVISAAMSAKPTSLLRQPLIRLLAVNLAIGAGVALLLTAGLIALNPAHLRELILADRMPGAALALLLFGFLITFGSAAMGTAIMMLGREPRRDRGGKAQAVPDLSVVPAKAGTRTP